MAEAYIAPWYKPGRRGGSCEDGSCDCHDRWLKKNAGRPRACQCHTPPPAAPAHEKEG